MDQTRDYAYKLGCGRLIFEHGALQKLGTEAARLGRRAYVIGGETALLKAGAKAEAALLKEEIPYVIDRYAGPCSEEKAREIAETCARDGADVIIGIGGGRIMDLTKMAADVSGLPVINAPTISATCAAYTPLSVVYTPSGACRGTWYFRREVDAVLCDLDELLNQPARCLAAGMLDAMAKHVEIAHHKAVLASAGQDAALAQLLAKTLYDDLLLLGPDALQALSAQKGGAAAERCIFHAIVTTGLISGIARGLYQSAMGHALYESIRTRFTAQSKPFLHGEVVAVGLLLEEYYLGNEQGAQRLLAMMQSADMPDSLQAIGVPHTEDARRALAQGAPVPDFFLNGPSDAEKVYQILYNRL